MAVVVGASSLCLSFMSSWFGLLGYKVVVGKMDEEVFKRCAGMGVCDVSEWACVMCLNGCV